MRPMSYYYRGHKSFSGFFFSTKRDLVKAKNRDFVFILDTSGSILGSEFEVAKEAIASLIEAFCPAQFG